MSLLLILLACDDGPDCRVLRRDCVITCGVYDETWTGDGVGVDPDDYQCWCRAESVGTLRPALRPNGCVSADGREVTP